MPLEAQHLWSKVLLKITKKTETKYGTLQFQQKQNGKGRGQVVCIRDILLKQTESYEGIE